MNKIYVIMQGCYSELKAHAEATGESLNAFIKRAIAEALERDRIDMNMNK